MSDYPNIVQVLETLRRNSYIGKQRHFQASTRTNRLHIWIGLPSVIIGVILGSTFFVLISKEIPVEAKWAAAFAGLVAAILSAVQTFFNFQKTSEAHRTVANQYLALERDCEQLIARFCDKLVALEELAGRVDDINDRYQEVNKAAEGLRTNQQDYQHAIKELALLDSKHAERGYLLKGWSQRVGPDTDRSGS